MGKGKRYSGAENRQPLAYLTTAIDMLLKHPQSCRAPDPEEQPPRSFGEDSQIGEIIDVHPYRRRR